MFIVGNGLVITVDEQGTVLENGAVVVEGNLIKEIGDTAAMKAKYPQAEFMDVKGKVIMPGMINAHHHFYSTFARGIPSKGGKPAKTFGEVLEGLWWRLDKTLTLEDVYYSAMLPIIDCVKCGATTVFDHHASPHAVKGSLDMIAKAVLEAGIRACLCYELSDRDGEKITQEGIEENVDFLKRVAQNNEGDMLAASFGLHASLTLSDETLRKAKEAASALGAGFHVHTAEGPEDVEDSLKKSGMRVVERLNSFGILGPKTLAIHCVHVNDREIEILAETGTNVVHNPESNMGNAVGVSPVTKMLNAGVTVGLGTDGFTSDMFESVKVANVLHKHAAQDPSASWAEVPQMIFDNNQKIAAKFFQKPLGKLVPGAYADIIVVDYYPWTPVHSGNYYGHVLFGMSGRAVETTIVNGKVLMKDRQLLFVDEAEVAAKARELAVKVWERF
ncbi:MAG TPA: putative aminohydrolase SsnA [Clostridia bacterium]|nr:putative aminohydrolase SsnA [Clostridia bacterium]